GSAAQGSLPPALVATTLKGTLLVASGGTARTIFSAHVVALSEGVLKAMWLTKFKVFALVCVALVPAVLGLSGALVYRRAAENPARAALPPAPANGDNNKPAEREPALKKEALERWGQAEAVVAARLVKVDVGPRSLSNPPIHHHTLHLQINKTL